MRLWQVAFQPSTGGRDVITVSAPTVKSALDAALKARRSWPGYYLRTIVGIELLGEAEASA